MTGPTDAQLARQRWRDRQHQQSRDAAYAARCARELAKVLDSIEPAIARSSPAGLRAAAQFARAQERSRKPARPDQRLQRQLDDAHQILFMLRMWRNA